MLIVVEGVDCSGKGEVCSRLSRAMNALLYKTPPEHMRHEQDLVNLNADNIEHYRYFVKVIQRASSELVFLTDLANVVVDRYWLTTIAYHRVMGLPACLADIGSIVLPDFTVYLTVSPEVQAVRMANRGMSPGDKRMDGRQNLIRQAYEEVLIGCDNVIRIDTTNLTPEQVVAMIVSQIPLDPSG